jgi:hypothetical protein
VAWSGSNGQDLVVELIDQVQRGGGIGGGEGLSMKRSKEIVEIVEAYDLTGRCRAAAKLTGCDRHTVAPYVPLLDAGQVPAARERRTRSR